MIDKEAIEKLQESAAIDAAATAIDLGIQKLGAAALPASWRIHCLEQYQPHRRRARGEMVTRNIASFAQYTEQNACLGATMFVDAITWTAQAVLNLGTPEEPGHADDCALLNFDYTAEYLSLSDHADGCAHSQRKIAEFLEDWSDLVTTYVDDEPVPVRQAIAAIRSIDIKAIREVGSDEQDLSSSRSALESVRASSKKRLPTRIDFSCRPHPELPMRTFPLRLSVTTSDDRPSIVLRIIREGAIRQEIAQDLIDAINAAMSGSIPVLLGAYTVQT